MSASLVPVGEAIELLRAERRELLQVGPHFKIFHEFRNVGVGKDCFHGELITMVVLVFRGREYPLRLPVALRLLFDYLAHHDRGHSAAAIVAGLRADQFYARHGANVRTGAKLTRKFSYTGIKEYVKRLRRALQVAFDEAGLRLAPFAVLVSEPTEGNEVRYRLKATVEWVHLRSTTYSRYGLAGLTKT